MTSRPLSEWPRLAVWPRRPRDGGVCRWLGVDVNAATVSTTFLLVVLVVAASSRLACWR